MFSRLDKKLLMENMLNQIKKITIDSFHDRSKNNR